MNDGGRTNDRRSPTGARLARWALAPQRPAAPPRAPAHRRRWILRLHHDSDTGLRRTELVEALTDPERGLPLELRGHRDLIPGGSLDLVRLKSPDNTTLQLPYDRIDYPIGEVRAALFAAIRRRTNAPTSEVTLRAMPGCSATG